MRNDDQLNKEKLDKILNIRISQNDYKMLCDISKNSQSSISKIIRPIIRLILDMTTKNNPKINSL